MVFILPLWISLYLWHEGCTSVCGYFCFAMLLVTMTEGEEPSFPCCLALLYNVGHQWEKLYQFSSFNTSSCFTWSYNGHTTIAKEIDAHCLQCLVPTNRLKRILHSFSAWSVWTPWPIMKPETNLDLCGRLSAGSAREAGRDWAYLFCCLFLIHF